MGERERESESERERERVSERGFIYVIYFLSAFLKLIMNVTVGRNRGWVVCRVASRLRGRLLCWLQGRLS